jgi:hypothetical protein
MLLYYADFGPEPPFVIAAWLIRSVQKSISSGVAQCARCIKASPKFDSAVFGQAVHGWLRQKRPLHRMILRSMGRSSSYVPSYVRVIRWGCAFLSLRSVQRLLPPQMLEWFSFRAYYSSVPGVGGDGTRPQPRIFGTHFPFTAIRSRWTICAILNDRGITD